MSIEAHEYDTTINDLQFSPDRTYFITAGKDKSAKVSYFHFHCLICIFTNFVKAHFVSRPQHHEDLYC